MSDVYVIHSSYGDDSDMLGIYSSLDDAIAVADAYIAGHYGNTYRNLHIEMWIIGKQTSEPISWSIRDGEWIVSEYADGNYKPGTPIKRGAL